MVEFTRSSTHPRLLLLAAVIACVPLAAGAVDGTIEINQTTAMNGGVNGDFVIDPPGFPVMITQPGSYRLTGNLTVMQATETGILIGANHVTIDFNGFGVIGAGIPGTGHGVASNVTNPFCCGDFATVMNGFVRNAAASGVSLNSDGRVERMTIENSAFSGIKLTNRGIVLANRVAWSGNYGLELGATSGYADNSIYNSTFPSVSGGFAIGGNICDDGRCSAVPKRRFYLTPLVGDGSKALGQCAEGYHMAALFEIYVTSDLQYETTLGATRPDAGQGPPIFGGWVRTSGPGNVLDIPGSANCAVWTSQSATEYGTVVQLDGGWANASTSDVPPWIAATEFCSTQWSTWCVQD